MRISQKSKVKSQKLDKKSKAVKLVVPVVLVVLVVLFFSVFISSASASTGINKTINFQGKLSNSAGNNVADGTYTVVFTLYDAASGGTTLWDETQNVTTIDGLFQVSLGSVDTTLGSVNFNSDSIYLGIKVESDSEMTPRIRFAAAAYAFNADRLNGVTATQSANGFTLTGGSSTLKTLGVNNSLTFAGTDDTTITFQGTDTYVGRTTTDTLTNKTIGSTGLVFSGAATDITTATDEDFTVDPNGTGDTIFTSDEDTAFLIGSSANTPAVLSISGGIGSNASFIVNQTNSGDIFTASASGATKFKLGNTGILTLTNGETIDNDSVDNTIILASNGTDAAGVLRLPIKTTTGDPSLDANGNIYYNSADGKFRCFQAGAWTDCISAQGNFANTDSSTPVTLSNASETSVISASITPTSTTNKVWVVAAVEIQGEQNNGIRDITLQMRRGASCAAGTAVGSPIVVQVIDDTDIQTGTVNIADTPGVTTSTTYHLCAISSAGAPTANNMGITLYEPTGKAAVAGSLTVRETDSSPSVTNVATMEFGPATTSTDEFIVSDQTGGVARIRIGNQVGVLNQVETVTGGWTFNTAATTFTTALNANGGIATSVADQGLTFTPNGTGDVVFSTDSDTGVYIGSASNTPAVFSVSGGIGNNSALIVNQLNDGNIFTASAAGVTKFVVTNDGSASTSGNFVVNGNGFLQTTNANTLTVGGSTTGNIVLDSGSGLITLSDLTTAASGLTVTTGQNFTVNGEAFTDLTGNGLVLSGNTLALNLTSSGNTGAGSSNSGLEVSSSGLTLLKGCNDGQLLEYTDAGGWACADDDSGGGSGSSNWTLTSATGVLRPNNNTLDLLIGSTATESAKFAVLNVAGGTPTASLSAGTASGAYFTADGVFATRSKQTLSLGDPATTGEVWIRSGDSAVSTRPHKILINAGDNSGTNGVGGAIELTAGDADFTTGDGTGGNITITAGSNLGLTSNGTGGDVIITAGNSTSGGTPGDVTIDAGLDDVSFGTIGIGTNQSSTISIGRSGTANVITGSVRLASITSCSSLQTSGTGAVSCGSGSTGDGSSNWTLNTTTGVLRPNNTTVDLLLGGVATNSATFHVFGATRNQGTTAVASVAANTSFAGLVIDNKTGDLLTASSSGKSRFTVKQDGTIAIDSTKYAGCTALETDADGNLLCGTDSGTGSSSDIAITTNYDTVATLTNFSTETEIAQIDITPGTTTADVYLEVQFELVSGNNTDHTATFTLEDDATCTGTVLTTVSYAVSANAGTFEADLQIAGVDVDPGSSQQSYTLCASTDAVDSDIRRYYMQALVIDTGSDYAELYTTNDADLAAGDVVALDSSLKTGVKKTEATYQSTIFGIVATKPGQVIGNVEREGVKAMPIALSGRVPVKVSAENGEILPGDYLTSSSIPGVAMKSTKAGFIVGQAMTGYRGEGTGTVLAFVKTSWYDPDGYLLSTDGLRILQSSASAEQDAIEKQSFGLVDSAGQTITRVGAFTEAVVGNIQVGYAEAQSMVVTTSLNVKENIITGALTAGDVTAESLEVTTENISIGGLTLRSYITAVVEDVLRSEEEKKANAITDAVPGLLTQESGEALFRELLEEKVLSATASATVIASGSEAIPGEFEIASMSATPRNDELVLESLNVDGLATISSSLRVKENSLIEGVLTVVDTLLTKNIVISGIATFFDDVVFKGDVLFAKTPTFSKDTAGFAVIKKGADRVEIVFDKPYEQLPVVNASISLEGIHEPNGSEGSDEREKEKQEELEEAVLGSNIDFIITKRTPKGFMILLNEPVEEDLTFSWTALVVDNVQTFESNDITQSIPTPTNIVSSPSPAGGDVPDGTSLREAGSTLPGNLDRREVNTYEGTY